jgi:hypothetical protein
MQPLTRECITLPCSCISQQLPLSHGAAEYISAENYTALACAKHFYTLQVALGLERMSALMDLCNKFMLRRTSVVLKKLLPPKVEQVSDSAMGCLAQEPVNVVGFLVLRSLHWPLSTIKSVAVPYVCRCTPVVRMYCYILLDATHANCLPPSQPYEPTRQNLLAEKLPA